MEMCTLTAATADISGIEVITWVEESENPDGDVSAASYSRRSEALRDKVGYRSIFCARKCLSAVSDEPYFARGARHLDFRR